MSLGYSISEVYGLRVEQDMDVHSIIEAIAIHTMVNAGYDADVVYAFFSCCQINYSKATDCASAVRIAEIAFVNHWDHIMYGHLDDQ